MSRFPAPSADPFLGELTEDVERLLGGFQRSDSVRFRVFCGLWREARFPEVFLGLAPPDRKCFCRVAMATAVRYFLPPYSYQIRVGGLYLMFALFHTQPADPPLRLRLALRDWVPVRDFLRDSVESRHWDVVYVYRKLIASGAFHYTAMPHLLTFNKQQRPRKEPPCPRLLSRRPANPPPLPPEVTEELAHIQGLYEGLKAAAGVAAQVGVAHRDFALRLQRCVEEFTASLESVPSQTGGEETPGGDQSPGGGQQEEAESSSKRARLLASIKQRSYSHQGGAPRARRKEALEDPEGPEDLEVPQEKAPKKKRPPSLRARTWSSLGRTGGGGPQTWLLSVPLKAEGVSMKKLLQSTPYRL